MKTLLETIRELARPFEGARSDHAPVLESVGNANIVLLGAQTHGTHEFYRERANITRALIEQKKFNGVLIEADWPDSSRVNRFIHAEENGLTATDALSGFNNFPAWMWRNREILELVEWLRLYNDHASPEDKVSFYGMDIFSLHKSINAVVEYLERIDPAAANQARIHYGCFEHFGPQLKTYGLGANLGLTKHCEESTLKELIELRRHRQEYLRRDPPPRMEDIFSAEQNARLIESAEKYYRALFNDRTLAWNLREHHMTEVIATIATHLASHRGPGRIVAWSHNRHVGDSRAVQIEFPGMVTLGQLVRERFGSATILVGFTTCSGTVTCSADWWASPPSKMNIEPAVDGSYEALFRQTGHSQFMLDLRHLDSETKQLFGQRLERSIGVVYRSDINDGARYFQARLPEQFDAVIHLDTTRAVEALESVSEWEKGEMPETFPVGV